MRVNILATLCVWRYVSGIRHGATDIRRVATGMRHGLLPYADSTHDAVRHGCCLCCHARMLHVFPLLPLGGSVSAAPSFQLRPVFTAVSSRVPPGDTMSRFVGLGDKSWDNFKNYFQTQGLEFLFLSQGAQRAAFRGSISTKTPVLKLKCLFACEPPAAIGSESTQVAFRQFAKLQVAGLHC